MLIMGLSMLNIPLFRKITPRMPKIFGDKLYKRLEETTGVKLDDVPVSDATVLSLYTSPGALGVTEEEVPLEEMHLGIVIAAPDGYYEMKNCWDRIVDRLDIFRAELKTRDDVKRCEKGRRAG